MPSNEDDTTMQFPEKEKKQKIRKLDMSKFKNSVPRKPTSSHPILPAAKTTTSTMARTRVATTAPSSDRTCKRWGPPCPPILYSISPTPSPVDSDWSDEDWDGDIEREERKEKQRKEEEVKQRQRIEEEEKISNYYPPSPIYDPHLKRKFCPTLLLNRKLN